MEKNGYFAPELQLFAETAQTGVTEAAAVPQQEERAAPEQEKAAQTQDLQAEFEELIKGKYKQAFDDRMQTAIKGRLKNAKQAESRLQAVTPILEQLAEKYGVGADDMEGLQRAISQPQAQSPGQEAKGLYNAWLRQSQETKSLYPDFSMEHSLADPRFRALLRGGADVRTAYEALHIERIIPAAMSVAAKAVEARLARSIATSSSRPAENAMGSRAAAVIRTDVSSLSKSDIEDVARRVARGERVSFG